MSRFGGTVAVLLSTIGLIGCVGGVAGVWLFYWNASDRVQKVAARLDVVLKRATDTAGNVERAVADARTRVVQARSELADTRKNGGKGKLGSRAARSLLEKKLGPNIDDVGARLLTLSDAATAASALLQSAGELTGGRTGRLAPEQMEQWSGEAQQLSAALRKLKAALGRGDTEADGADLAAATGEVDGVLQRCQAKLGEWRSMLDAAREELPGIEADVFGWLRLVAVVVTVICVWAAAGQASLFVHGLRWCKGA
jgi:hypothetical protein